MSQYKPLPNNAHVPYLKREFALAYAKFEAVLAIDSQDKAARLHQQRCQHWLSAILPDDWDGIDTLTEK